MMYIGSDCLTLMVETIYFWYISQYYQGYMIYLISMSFLITILGTFFLIEPPITLLLRGQPYKANAGLRRI